MKTIIFLVLIFLSFKTHAESCNCIKNIPGDFVAGDSVCTLDKSVCGTAIGVTSLSTIVRIESNLEKVFPRNCLINVTPYYLSDADLGGADNRTSRATYYAVRIFLKRDPKEGEIYSYAYFLNSNERNYFYSLLQKLRSVHNTNDLAELSQIQITSIPHPWWKDSTIKMLTSMTILGKTFKFDTWNRND